MKAHHSSHIFTITIIIKIRTEWDLSVAFSSLIAAVATSFTTRCEENPGCWSRIGVVLLLTQQRIAHTHRSCLSAPPVITLAINPRSHWCVFICLYGLLLKVRPVIHTLHALYVYVLINMQVSALCGHSMRFISFVSCTVMKNLIIF